MKMSENEIKTDSVMNDSTLEAANLEMILARVAALEKKLLVAEFSSCPQGL